MKYLRATNKILDMEIHRDWEMRKLYLSHKNYIEKVLERFGIHGSELVSTLLTTHFKLSSALSSQSKKRESTCHMFLMLVNLRALCMSKFALGQIFHMQLVWWVDI